MTVATATAASSVSGQLVVEAAAQAAAQARELRGIEHESLLFSGFDRHRLEVFEPRATAQFSTAYPHATQESCLIPDTDLAHLDANVKAMCQIPHQLPKINPPFRREEKRRFTPIETVLDFP